MKIKPGLASAQQWKFTVFFSVLCTAIRQFHSRPRGFLLVTFGPHFSRILRFSRFQFPRLFCAFSCLFVAVNSAALRLRVLPRPGRTVFALNPFRLRLRRAVLSAVKIRFDPWPNFPRYFRIIWIFRGFKSPALVPTLRLCVSAPLR